MCSRRNCRRRDFYGIPCGGRADNHRLGQVPLEHYFPEYSGGSDINKATKYILWKYIQANRERLRVYPQYVRHLLSFADARADIVVSLTQATDTTNIRLVFAAVKETILQNVLEDSGIL